MRHGCSTWPTENGRRPTPSGVKLSARYDRSLTGFDAGPTRQLASSPSAASETGSGVSVSSSMTTRAPAGAGAPMALSVPRWPRSSRDSR